MECTDVLIIRELALATGVPVIDITTRAAEVTELELFQAMRISFSSLRSTGFDRLVDLRIVQCLGVNSLDGIESCVHLKRLAVIDCALTGCLSSVSFSPGLVELSLDGNGLTALGQCLRGCISLLTLSVCDNRLSSLQGVESCTALTAIRAAKNGMTTVFENMHDLISLESLDISGNNLASAFELYNLTALRTLRHLTLFNPHWGSNPVCSMRNYRMTALRLLPGVLTLDGILVSADDITSARRTYGLKRLYYAARRNADEAQMRGAAGLTAAISSGVESILRSSMSALRLAVLLMNQRQDTVAIDAMQSAIAARESCIKKQRESVAKLLVSTEHCVLRNETRGQLELHSGGTVRIDEVVLPRGGQGHDVPAWAIRCADLVKQRFSVSSKHFAGLSICGVRPMRVIRIVDKTRLASYEQRVADINKWARETPAAGRVDDVFMALKWDATTILGSKIIDPGASASFQGEVAGESQPPGAVCREIEKRFQVPASLVRPFFSGFGDSDAVSAVPLPPLESRYFEARAPSWAPASFNEPDGSGAISCPAISESTLQTHLSTVLSFDAGRYVASSGAEGAFGIPVSLTPVIDLPRVAEVIAAAMASDKACAWSRSPPPPYLSAVNKAMKCASGSRTYNCSGIAFASTACIPPGVLGESQHSPDDANFFGGRTPSPSTTEWIRNAGIDVKDRDTKASLSRFCRSADSFGHDSPSIASKSHAFRRAFLCVARLFTPDMETCNGMPAPTHEHFQGTFRDEDEFLFTTVLDPSLLLPEFIVEIEYVFEGDKVPISANNEEQRNKIVNVMDAVKALLPLVSRSDVGDCPKVEEAADATSSDGLHPTYLSNDIGVELPSALAAPIAAVLQSVSSSCFELGFYTVHSGASMEAWADINTVVMQSSQGGLEVVDCAAIELLENFATRAGLPLLCRTASSTRRWFEMASALPSLPELLTQVVPPRSNWMELTSLNLSACGLPTVEAIGLTDCRRLAHLDISFNRLSSLQGINALSALVSLNAAHNIIGRLCTTETGQVRLSSVVVGCPLLRTLKLADNCISTVSALGLPLLLQACCLVELDIRGNPLQLAGSVAIPCGHVQQCMSSLSHSGLRSIILAHLPELEELDGVRVRATGPPAPLGAPSAHGLSIDVNGSDNASVNQPVCITALPRHSGILNFGPRNLFDSIQTDFSQTSGPAMGILVSGKMMDLGTVMKHLLAQTDGDRDLIATTETLSLSGLSISSRMVSSIDKLRTLAHIASGLQCLDLSYNPIGPSLVEEGSGKFAEYIYVSALSCVAGWKSTPTGSIHCGTVRDISLRSCGLSSLASLSYTGTDAESVLVAFAQVTNPVIPTGQPATNDKITCAEAIADAPDDEVQALQLDYVYVPLLWKCPLACCLSIQTLDLSWNALDDSAVASAGLGCLPRLRELRVDGNLIRSLSCIANCFHVVELYATHNAIGFDAAEAVSLSSLEPLAGLAKLFAIQLTGNPVSIHKGYKQEVLYRCPQLQLLDAVVVSPDEIARAKQQLSGRLTMSFLRKRLATADDTESGNSASNENNVFGCLEELDCSGCGLTAVDDLSLPHLRSLKLRGNVLSPDCCTAIAALPRLQELDLAFNTVISMQPTMDTLSGKCSVVFAALCYLDLSSNGIVDVELIGLGALRSEHRGSLGSGSGSFPALTYLNLSSNKITRLTASFLAPNNKIGHLVLDGNPLRQIEGDWMSSCGVLHTLSIERATLRSLSWITPSHSLSTLRLDGNRMTDINELAALRRLSALNDLSLVGNPVTRHNNYPHILLQHTAVLENLDFRPVVELFQGLHASDLNFNGDHEVDVPNGLTQDGTGVAAGPVSLYVGANETRLQPRVLETEQRWGVPSSPVHATHGLGPHFPATNKSGLTALRQRGAGLR